MSVGQKKLEGKIALVTGASRGIGAAVAKRYAKEGAHVIMAARSVKGLEEVDDYIKSVNGNATLVPLDLTDGSKIDQLGALIHQRFGKLDILVGNAAQLGELSPVAHIVPKVWDNVIAVNLTSNYRLIRSMHPLLNMASGGRAIFVSSGLARTTIPYYGSYAVSKAGLEMLVKLYAAENVSSNIRANLIDPGMIDTEMLAQAMPGKDKSSYPKPDDITGKFVELALESCQATGEVFKCY
jgi:NAD(P)-dependent dehydrogenase (short-subunit alcohol dehydrogenase family)